MTIAILSQSKTQTVARPFNRASDTDELIWVLVYHAAYKANEHLGPGRAMSLAKVAANATSLTQSGAVVWGNLDTEKPVLTLKDGTKFYAFTEA